MSGLRFSQLSRTHDANGDVKNFTILKLHRVNKVNYWTSMGANDDTLKSCNIKCA